MHIIIPLCMRVTATTPEQTVSCRLWRRISDATRMLLHAFLICRKIHVIRCVSATASAGTLFPHNPVLSSVYSPDWATKRYKLKVGTQVNLYDPVGDLDEQHQASCDIQFE